MRRFIFIPLLLLVACSLPNIAVLKDGLWGKTAKQAVKQPAVQQTNGKKPVTAITAGVIQTQTLAPVGQTAPITVPPAPAIKTPDLPKATPIPTSLEEVACRAKGGQWGKAGKLAAMTCYIPSKDAGKTCSKQSDCTSQCLARSKTCAPIWPIFGCSEVLQNDGSLVTLCID